MSELKIVSLPAEVLRQRTRPVTDFGPDTQKLIDDMIETMRVAEGVGLAAPQVGRPLQLAVIETPPDEDEDGNEIEGTSELFVIANPEIYWTSRKLVNGVEGCLSIPGYLGEVERYDSIRIRAQDRYGRKLRMRLYDWTARIFQHEVDHINGVLYIDKLSAPDRIWTEEEFRAMREAEQKNGDAGAASNPIVGD